MDPPGGAPGYPRVTKPREARPHRDTSWSELRYARLIARADPPSAASRPPLRRGGRGAAHRVRVVMEKRRARPRSVPRQPRFSASQVASESRAPSAIAAQQCSTHVRTPSGVPVR